MRSGGGRLSRFCHSADRKRFTGRVVELERVRVERLAEEIAGQLRAGYGNVLRRTDAVDDVDRWRRAARRAGRLLGVPVRTGVSFDRSRVWAIDES